VAIGEVGLAGEIRRVPGMSRRLAEAERMGFRCAIVPPGSGGLPAGPAAANSARSRAGRSDGLANGPLTDIREAPDLRTAIAAALG
jgi:hypothetical protein